MLAFSKRWLRKEATGHKGVAFARTVQHYDAFQWSANLILKLTSNANAV